MESLGAESCVLVFYQKKLKRLGSKKGKQIIDNYTILNQIYVSRDDICVCVYNCLLEQWYMAYITSLRLIYLLDVLGRSALLR